MGLLFYLILTLVASANEEYVSTLIDRVLTSDILVQWRFECKPLHSRIAIDGEARTINIKIEFTMPTDHFARYGALFQYALTFEEGDILRIIDVDYSIHQFLNGDNSKIKTQITDFQIHSHQLKEFVNKQVGILISFHDPSLKSEHTSDHFGDFHVKYYPNAIFFYSPTQPIIFDHVPSFYWSQDYNFEESQFSIATTVSNGLCITVKRINAELNKSPIYIRVIWDNQHQNADEFTTNIAQYDQNENAYLFEHGFCIMHEEEEEEGHRTVKFQFIQAEDQRQILSLSYLVFGGVNDFLLSPLKEKMRGSVDQNGQRNNSSLLVSVRDYHSDLKLETFKPYVHSTQSPVVTNMPKAEQSTHIKKTCVYLKHAELVKQFDRFSKNDAFVKIVPDYDNDRAVISATIKDRNNPIWNEQFCFDGVINEFEFHLYDVDNIGIAISEKHMGSGTITMNSLQRKDVKITLSDISQIFIGTLMADIIYIFDKTASDPNTFQIVHSGNKNQQKQPKTQIIKTCVGIIKAAFYKNSDQFSPNDAFVKVVPNYSESNALKTKTMPNANNPKWNQVLCFDGNLKKFEFFVYDIDRIPTESVHLIGMATLIIPQSVDGHDVELMLVESENSVGLLWINLFYIYGGCAVEKSTQNPTKYPTLIPTQKPSLQPTKKPTRFAKNTTKKPTKYNVNKAKIVKPTSVPTKTPSIALFEPGSIHQISETCVDIQRGVFHTTQDTFTKNDIFVKVVPDYNVYKARSTHTAKNSYYPAWAETFCFEDEVNVFEFHIYDVDELLPSTKRTHIGYSALSVNGQARNNSAVIFTNNTGQRVGSIQINVYFKYMQGPLLTHKPTLSPTNLPTHRPTLNILDNEYLSTLSLYTDGYLLLGRGKCRDANGQKPLYYHVKLDPFADDTMDDPHGHCRAFCSLSDDCLGYVYHLSGKWKYSCAIYVSMAIGDESKLYYIVNSDNWSVSSNADVEIRELSTIERFTDADVSSINDRILGFCFIKTQSPPPIIRESCININAFDALMDNPMPIQNAHLKANSKPKSEEFSLILKDGVASVCWEHGIEGFDVEFSSQSTGMGGVLWIGSASQPIGRAMSHIVGVRSKLRQKTVVSNAEKQMVYDMTYDYIVNADHYGCCYGVHYEQGEVITFLRMMTLKLSQCVLDESRTGSTYFALDVACSQLQNVLSADSEFVYIGDGGCRDEQNLAPSRYWHDKLEFHSCSLQCLSDASCLGIMYKYDGRSKGRCLVYTSSLSLKQLYEDGNVIPHQGWKWIDADHGANALIVQSANIGQMDGRCFAKYKLSDIVRSGLSTVSIPQSPVWEELDALDDGRIINEKDPLSLPWPNQQKIFDLFWNDGIGMSVVCVLGQLQRSTFDSVDGEYIFVAMHFNKPVWYNRRNGYYLYWNVDEKELQIYDDIVDEDYFAALSYGKYWRMNGGEQDIFDHFLRLIPNKCPQTVCILIDCVVSPLPFSFDTVWIDINSMNNVFATNKSTAKKAEWKQRFCFPPSPIALLQLMVDNDQIIGKFHVSPLTEGAMNRPVYTSSVNESIFIRIVTELIEWDGNDGEYPIFSNSLTHIGGDDAEHMGTLATFHIEADRYKWIGYIGQKMTMMIHAFGTKEGNVEWSLINPGSLEIAISDVLIVPDSPTSDLMQLAMSKNTNSEQWDEEPVASAAILSATPHKKRNYQIVIVAYEKNGFQSASIEIEVQILRAPQSVNIDIADDKMLDTEEEREGDIGESVSEMLEEHAKNMWILWWVLGTVGITLSAVVCSFVMLKNKHFKKHTRTKRKSHGIEMNPVKYHTVQRNTLKVTESGPG